MIKEGVLFDQLPDNRAKCNVCEHRCVRSEGKIGFCGTRKNIDGKIYSLIYNTVFPGQYRMQLQVRALPELEYLAGHAGRGAHKRDHPGRGFKTRKSGRMQIDLMDVQRARDMA